MLPISYHLNVWYWRHDADESPLLALFHTGCGGHSIGQFWIFSKNHGNKVETVYWPISDTLARIWNNETVSKLRCKFSSLPQCDCKADTPVPSLSQRGYSYCEYADRCYYHSMTWAWESLWSMVRDAQRYSLVFDGLKISDASHGSNISANTLCVSSPSPNSATPLPHCR